MTLRRRDELPLDGEKIRFILSAGRTGTVFLSQRLAGLYPQHEVVHEPPTSRRVFMAWNAEAAGWLPEGTARRMFVANRRRVLAGLAPGRVRIEINPFLHPLAPVLHELVRPLRVVHLVRDPRDWIRSMANFGAAGWRRHVIEFVPFARTVHPEARSRWRSLDTISRFAWRWRLANEQLRASGAHADHYCLIRYEDLFSEEQPLAQATARRLFDSMPPRDSGGELDANRERRVNPSRGGKVGPWQHWPRETQQRVMEICAPLLAPMGYA